MIYLLWKISNVTYFYIGPLLVGTVIVFLCNWI